MNAKDLVQFFVIYVVVWIVLWIPFRYYTPLALRIRHTYQLPSANCTNTLVSDLGTFDAVREGLMEIYIVIPFTVCLMLWASDMKSWLFHITLCILACAWGAINFAYDVNNLIYANVPPNDANFKPENLARDNRWCLYWGGQVGTDLLCANTGPCVGANVSAVDPDTFMINASFLTRFAFNVLIILLIVIDIWMSWAWKVFISPPSSTDDSPPPPSPTDEVSAKITRFYPRKK